MEKITLDSFGEIMNNILKEYKIQMLLTLPEGSLDVQVKDNVGLGSVVQFYILLNSIKPIASDMKKQIKIDPKSSDWEKVVDTLLEMVKGEMMENA